MTTVRGCSRYEDYLTENGEIYIPHLYIRRLRRVGDPVGIYFAKMFSRPTGKTSVIRLPYAEESMTIY